MDEWDSCEEDCECNRHTRLDEWDLADIDYEYQKERKLK